MDMFMCSSHQRTVSYDALDLLVRREEQFETYGGNLISPRRESKSRMRTLRWLPEGFHPVACIGYRIGQWPSYISKVMQGSSYFCTWNLEHG